jgi:hypothetical protein
LFSYKSLFEKVWAKRIVKVQIAVKILIHNKNNAAGYYFCILSERLAVTVT